ncbi:MULTISPECIES: glycoside hydrolase family 16 protein [unclassified Arcicella]|uniref:glycoside hydrolase family 16 protein n=1 Tax=unclassified Arcicella TaxID=2644986 RepID=UPI0028596674|nr:MULTISPECIES: glycoside hydrolase family 16 protein [unclassified Arcicella]MDR6564516.1 beta-glucanase (GH16 family) [Arcicella sp. BE51]MDR6814375.1 beta-glucanase (GH16 family) [Arcicella sp. BE140]MDR6825603.1 beta-glucanase (GH16 family) [Arcicella sp. BE139]
MNKLTLCSVISILIIVSACSKESTVAQVPTPVIPAPTAPIVYEFESTPIWADEFDKDGLPDSKKWNYDVGGSGWGNNELEYYTKENLKNARVENGKLVIEAIKENFNGNSYTSARLVTKDKGDFLYGRFEIKAKLPAGRGTWPAIWMLATEQSYSNKYWPDNGEIDIMEHVGYDPGRVHASIHTKSFNHVIGTQVTTNMMVDDFDKAFHEYRLDWTPNKIEMYIDAKLYFTFENTGKGFAEYPFDKKFHLLLNLAVGGNWGGVKGVDESVFPQRMEVDYVRIYALKK